MTDSQPYRTTPPSDATGPYRTGDLSCPDCGSLVTPHECPPAVDEDGLTAIEQDIAAALWAKYAHPTASIIACDPRSAAQTAVRTIARHLYAGGGA